jgi:GTP cyclohydrolase II
MNLLFWKREYSVNLIDYAPLPTATGDWTYFVFYEDKTKSHHEALVYGNTVNGAIGDGEDFLCRVHSSCRTNEYMMHSIVNV